MSGLKGVEFYHQFLVDRHAAFQSKFEFFLTTLIASDAKQKIAAAKSTLGSLDTLREGIPSGQQPNWLAPLRQRLNKYIQREGHADAAKALLDEVLRRYESVQKQDWDHLLDYSAATIDFDALFQQYYADSRLGELFEQLMGLLDQVVSSGQVDSLRVVRALEGVMATLRTNMHGSRLSTFGSWEFAKHALKNTVLEVLSDIPGLGSVVRGVVKTMDEIEEEMGRLDGAIKEEIASRASQVLLLPETSSEIVAALPPGGVSEDPEEDLTGKGS